ncbi:related to actin-like protein [Phialocephala subalpina]|uniref:Related to actin-like protein n=1 Tax=Phialocephala subalpina TaxID=576137 RepID=A0A1L7WP72_9HELO|nr:related to actin-like protein [Phialocephala subalpina]
MVGKKSGKALLREEGLQRTDNGMKQSSWPEIQMINQKNYYTDYMKRDDQHLALRLQNEANRDRMIRNAKDKDRALAMGAEGELDEDESMNNDGLDATKIIVIHPGSQNMRIGFASDALPKTIPMAIAEKWPINESQDVEPRPKRQKLDVTPEQQFGEEFAKKFTKMSNDLKVDMRANKRKVLPNSKELVVNYNRRIEPEKIPEHNDPMRIEWTDISKDDPEDVSSYFTGMEALRIPDDSKPKYKVHWPIQHGCLHENDYMSASHLINDLESFIESALRKELGLNRSGEWPQYSCVVVIPDLYDKKYVEQILELCMKEFEFKQVAFIQESLAATYGAGYSTACIVDIGAQKTSICCVEDGMCIEDSRINLKYGGFDVTETFLKMMLFDHFPYQDINLKRRYDFLLAEELKTNFCTMDQALISTQLYDFHLRAPNQPTRKYQFKTYDEVILAPMGFFDPSIFDNSEKLAGRRKYIERSYNAYDPEMPDDPTSAAQLAILTSIKPSLATTANGFTLNGNGNMDVATPSKEKPNPLNFFRNDSEANGNSRVTSAAGSPAPEGANTPVPSGPYVFGANGTNGGSPGPGGTTFQFGNGSHNSGTPNPPPGMFVDPLARTQKDFANERDAVLPIAPLDIAINTSIMHAVKGEEKKTKDFYGGIMVIGGGAKTPGLGPFLEDRLKKLRPDLAAKQENLQVGTSPREMDGQVVVWKGASVFARMKTHESWVGPLEYERLGSRVLTTKVLWNY